MNTCPVCGGTVVKVESMNGMVDGTARYSLCCDIGTDIIEQWDILESLPALHRSIAIEQSRQERADYTARQTAAVEWLNRQPVIELPPNCYKE